MNIFKDIFIDPVYTYPDGVVKDIYQPYENIVILIMLFYIIIIIFVCSSNKLSKEVFGE